MLDTTDMETVEYLRNIMIKTAEERGNLTHPDVIEISQRLDILINTIQLEHYRAKRRLITCLIRKSFYRRFKSHTKRIFHPPV